MNTKYVGLLVAFVLAGCATSGGSKAVISAKNKVAPALIHVSPVKEVFRRGERREVSVTGSGFIISPDGYVVTNEHVAGKSDYVRCVLFDRDEVEGVLSGSFYQHDAKPSTAKIPSPVARKAADAKPSHYKVICISMYTDALQHLDLMVKELKARGHTKANRSALIRHALSTVDLDGVPRAI